MSCSHCCDEANRSRRAQRHQVARTPFQSSSELPEKQQRPLWCAKTHPQGAAQVPPAQNLHSKPLNDEIMCAIKFFTRLLWVVCLTTEAVALAMCQELASCAPERLHLQQWQHPLRPWRLHVAMLSHLWHMLWRLGGIKSLHLQGL